MNIPAIHNNQPEINNLSFVSRAFNKAVKVIKSEPFVNITTYGIINMCTLTMSSCVVESIPEILLVNAIINFSSVLLSTKRIKSIYIPRSLIDLPIENNRRTASDMITGNRGSFCKMGRKSQLPLKISYDEL